MATSSNSNPGPTPTAAAASSAATPAQLQAAFDNSIWYLLSLWQPLHIAVTSGWGGPTSADKRDWFAGAVSTYLSSLSSSLSSSATTATTATTTERDAQEDLECVLLQIMQDEFDCNVEDESEVGVARDILAVRRRLMDERTLEAAREVEARWRNRGQMKGSVRVEEVEAEEGEWEGFDDDDDDDDDEEMGEDGGDAEDEAVPQLVRAPRERAEPEVDAEGFTRVVGRKKR